MDYLSLFSGAAGGDLGLQHLLGWNCKGYVEWDKYCCRVLEQRIKDGLLSDAPIFCGDIREWIRLGYAASYQGMVGAIAGGFPCQPFSVAGKRAGADDPRNMWPATVECLRIIRPRFALLENVPGLLAAGYFDTIIGELTESGYDCRWRVLSAAEVGAPHKRDRLWIVAHADGSRCTWDPEDAGGVAKTSGVPASDGARPHSASGTERTDMARGTQYPIKDQPVEWRDVADTNSQRQPQPQGADQDQRRRFGDSGTELADTESDRRDAGRLSERARAQESQPGINGEVGNASSQGLQNGQHDTMGRIAQGASFKQPQRSTWWEAEPDMGRLVDGLPNRVDRLKALGNAQVPLVAATAWRLLTEDLL